MNMTARYRRNRGCDNSFGSISNASKTVPRREIIKLRRKVDRVRYLSQQSCSRAKTAWNSIFDKYNTTCRRTFLSGHTRRRYTCARDLNGKIIETRVCCYVYESVGEDYFHFKSPDRMLDIWPEIHVRKFSN